MKSLAGFLIPLTLLGVNAVFATDDPSKCHADNCARAVTGTHQGPVFTSQAKADCYSYVVETSYGHTATVTAASLPAETAKPVPTYASACEGSSRYISACSCYGITSQVVTAAEETTTVTVTPTYTGPGYQPTVPTSYSECQFDPDSEREFELFTPNAMTLMNQDGKAVELVDADAVPATFTFSHPPSAPDGVYDIVTSGANPLYLAVFESGEVGFVSASSNGQSYVSDGSGDEYMTSIWSVKCDGLATAGIIGGMGFHFTIRDNGDVVVASAFPARKLRKTRDIPVPEGFFVLPTEVPTPAGSKCPSPVQHAVTRDPPVPLTSNGCGPANSWKWYVIPDLQFEEACNFHDVCWSTCSETMASCNSGFFNRMLAICAATHDPNTWIGWRLLIACNNAARFYTDRVSGPAGAAIYTGAVQEYCECECIDPELMACADQCVDAKNDPDNCGDCGFTCPSRGCTNGACSWNSCTGQTCSTFGPCGAGGNCVCASITEGDGFCADGSTPCDGLAGCGNSAGCPLGSVCAVGTCCGRNVCIPADQCGGFNTNSPRWIFSGKRDWNGPTVGHPAVYVEDGEGAEA